MKSALTSILKIADLLTKKAFVVAFYDESCRFGNKPWLFEKLRKDMLFQWNQMGFDRTIDLHGDADPKTIREAAQATAVGLAEWANRTADNRGIKILKKDTRLGTVNPDEVGELLLKVLSWEVMAEAKSADDIHRPSMFYYWNTLHSFRTFFKAKKTVTGRYRKQGF
jgi:hypothetical protein